MSIIQIVFLSIIQGIIMGVVASAVFIIIDKFITSYKKRNNFRYWYEPKECYKVELDRFKIEALSDAEEIIK